MTYKVIIKPVALKTLKKLPKDIQLRIRASIDLLAINPRPPKAIKLVNRSEYRIRVSTYRVVYQIRDNELIILIVKVGHRKNVYEN